MILLESEPLLNRIQHSAPPRTAGRICQTISRHFGIGTRPAIDQFPQALPPKFGALTALGFLLAGSATIAYAADNSAPVHSVDGSFVREWLVLGPFPSPEMETDFLADAGGEANVRPKEGDAVTRKDGTILRWTRFRSERDLVSLDRVFGIHTRSVAYVYCELRADQAGETDVRIHCGFSESALWLSGKQLGPFPAHLGRT
ncbi:MAG: hypothetical protein FJ403_01720 [Verrucomicrobia bacterium]|nr:hypothetical protein [Verrucomicrobiota bacterium]